MCKYTISCGAVVPGGKFIPILLLLAPFMILCIKYEEVIEQILPDGGDVMGSDKLPLYRAVIDLSGRKHIRFSVKTGWNANILFSERQANTIDTNTDNEYIEVIIGGWGNSKSIIRVETLGGHNGRLGTPNILNANTFKEFWVSWKGGVIKVGRGFFIGKDVFMEKPFPSGINVNFLALFNGYGTGGQWKIFTGIYYLSIYIHSMYFHVFSSKWCEIY